MQDFLASRGIEYILHFTCAENLPSIFEYGLLGRISLEAARIAAEVNDEYRLDGMPDAVCCSISFPNYRMFYKVRQENPNLDWAILRIRAEVLWQKQCVFCVENAAKQPVAETSIESRIGVAACREIFADYQGGRSRSELKIPNSYPTNPQAEVLVLDGIEPEFIDDVLVDEARHIRNFVRLKEIGMACRGIDAFYHHGDYFFPRMDYEYWRGA